MVEVGEREEVSIRQRGTAILLLAVAAMVVEEIEREVVETETEEGILLPGNILIQIITTTIIVGGI